jgi:hypothetical protein
MVKFFFVLLCISHVSWGQDCSPSKYTCDFYLCLENNIQCGEKGYPLRYGYRFCKEIQKIKNGSLVLQNWLNETRYCLQEKLLEKKQFECQLLFDQSVIDHTNCYLENGYCELPIKDKKIIRKQILKSFLKAPLFILQNAESLLKDGCLK